MHYAPMTRIILRYVAGGLLMGSPELGEMLAADPDLIAVGAAALACVVEVFYARAKAWGGKT